jgi:GNAT superfamily N-acetyltransferase
VSAPDQGRKARASHVGTSPLRIRRGTAKDVPAIVKLIRALAKYERLSRYLRLDAKRLRRDGFGKRRYFQTLLCTRNGRPIGYAIYYSTYSTFSCRPVLFVEDIFVVPEERGRGAGKAIMSALARIAVNAGCRQMEWIVLDWNTPSIEFYRRLGARLDKTWILTRLTEARLSRLANQPRDRRSLAAGGVAGRDVS